MATYFTDFGSETNGALNSSADWGVTLFGAWTMNVQTDGGAASGKSVLTQDNAAGDAFNIARNDAIIAAGTTGDVELVAKFKVATASGIANYTELGPSLTSTSDSDDQYVLVKESANFVLYYIQDGTPWAQIGSTSAFAFSNDTYVWVRIGRSGSTIRAKIWTHGSSEPGSWTFSGTDTTLSSLRAGFAVKEADAGAITWEIFGVGTDGDAAPTSGGGGGPTDQYGRSDGLLKRRTYRPRPFGPGNAR